MVNHPTMIYFDYIVTFDDVEISNLKITLITFIWIKNKSVDMVLNLS